MVAVVSLGPGPSPREARCGAGFQGDGGEEPAGCGAEVVRPLVPAVEHQRLDARAGAAKGGQVRLQLLGRVPRVGPAPADDPAAPAPDKPAAEGPIPAPGAPAPAPAQPAEPNPLASAGVPDDADPGEADKAAGTGSKDAAA